MANVNYIEKKVVTPVGEVFFPKVNTAIDEFEGQRKYVINLAFNEADEKMMKAMFDKWLKDAKELPENEGKKWRSMDDPRIGYRFDEKSGKTLFTFKTNAFRKTDSGEIQNYVPVFNEYGVAYPNTTSIGNGSKAQVRFDSSWSYKSKDSNNLSMWLTGIVVHELVEFGGTSTAGFEFKKPPTASEVFGSNEIPEEEIPF